MTRGYSSGIGFTAISTLRSQCSTQNVVCCSTTAAMAVTQSPLVGGVQTETGAISLRHEVDVGRAVAFDVLPDERAERQHGPAARSGVVQPRCHERRAEPLPLVGRIDLGVRERAAAAAVAVV